MRFAYRLGIGSLVLLVLAPALRLNVFSTHEAFELRRFLFALIILSAVALLLTGYLLTVSQSGAPWALGVAAVVMLCLFTWPAFNAVGEASARILGTLLGQAVLPVLIAGVLITLATRLSTEPTFHVLLFVVSAAMAISQLALVLQRSATVESEGGIRLNTVAADYAAGPDVYVIVLDAYLRHDVLSGDLGFDNSDFLNFLQTRSFEIPEQARSNYNSTYASLSSMFAMDYILQPGSTDSADMAVARGLLRGAGPAVDIFRSAGYEFVYVESPWSVSACGPEVDVCYSYWTFGETAKWLGEFTIFAELIDVGSWKVSTDRALDQFTILRELAETRTESPRLIYAHIGIPHPPFTLDARCGRWDNPTSKDWEVTPESSDPYLQQLECVNHQVQELIETIDRSDPNSVVMVTADHGLSLHGQWGMPIEDWSEAQIQESLAILTAYRLPSTCQAPQDTEFELVNGFRLVVDCLFDMNLGPLPARFFHAFPLEMASIEIDEIPESRG